MRGTPLALLLIPVLLAGCTGPAELPAPGSDPSASPPAEAAPANHTLPNITLQVVDLRAHPLDTPRVRFDLTFDEPTEAEQPLYTGWLSQEGGRSVGETTRIPANTTTWNTTHGLALGHGAHSIQAIARWTGGNGDADPHTADFDYTVWVPARLVLNASKEYAEEQNPFHSDHRIPYAPWEDESALHILRRAADSYGFEIKTDYRSDLEAHFVDAINGTAFQWELEAAGISRNWMILIDDEASRNAVDHTYPEPDETLEFRYVRCYATGNCDDM